MENTKITVNNDLTAGQIQPDSAEGLQVVLETSEPVSEYSDGGTVIRGDNLVKVTRKVTTLSRLRDDSDGIDGQIASLQSQIDLLNTRKGELAALIPKVEESAGAAISATLAAAALQPGAPAQEGEIISK